jgi:nuclear pore complex protein Nup155
LQAITNITEVITAVALIRRRPVPGRRQSAYLLLLATPVAVNVIDLEFDPDNGVDGLDNYRDTSCKVSLQRGKVEQVPTDNVTMGSIVGTPDGRVFMAGSDGAVYELLYGRAAQGWFTSSRQKYVPH